MQSEGADTTGGSHRRVDLTPGGRRDPLLSRPQRAFAAGLAVLMVLTTLQASRAFGSAEQAAEATTGAQTTTLLVGYTQRESLATLVAVERWLLGQATRRDVQIARGLLERRLSTMDGDGTSAHELVGDEYHAALYGLDDALAAAPPGILPPGERIEAAQRVEPTVVSFAEQSKFLTDRYQNYAEQVLSTTSGEARQQMQLLLVVLGTAVAAGVILVLWLARGVRARYRAAAILEHRATHDSLTGLLNRHEILNRVHVAIRAEGCPGSIALLFVDLDGFKQVNDDLGHKAGDHLLVEIGGRLQSMIADDPSKIVGRLGGDEFVILCARVQEASEAEAVAMQAILEISRPVDVGGTAAVVGASVGIAIMEPESASPEDLMRNADLAMYRAKRAGDGSFHLHCEESDGSSDEDVMTQLHRRRAYRDLEDGSPESQRLVGRSEPNLP